MKLTKASIFSKDQEQSVVDQSRFLDEVDNQGICPACGKKTLRTYAYIHESRLRKSLVTYVWCASCRRMKSWFGAFTLGIEFTDPLAHYSSAARTDMERDIDTFLRRLDHLWDRGELPQTKVAKNKR
ncbi:hypothetical protein [Streptomyces sp. PU-14G]|uniref:hypothetical protein n=1 Tax=Streptomyces sp. PU-14G TaxID=2800808 RepID=UPI0034DFA253